MGYITEDEGAVRHDKEGDVESVGNNKQKPERERRMKTSYLHSFTPSDVDRLLLQNWHNN